MVAYLGGILRGGSKTPYWNFKIAHRIRVWNWNGGTICIACDINNEFEPECFVQIPIETKATGTIQQVVVLLQKKLSTYRKCSKPSRRKLIYYIDKFEGPVSPVDVL